MSPRAPLRNQGVTSTCDSGNGVESRRSCRQHQPSRFAREKPLSHRTSQSRQFKDKGLKEELLFRPPHADRPLEFVKKANGYSVHVKHSGSQPQSDQVRISENSEDELIKFMSKVPKYLQKGERPQGNLLNFGVLDWGRLEKWTHDQGKGTTTSLAANTGSSVPSARMKAETRAYETEKGYGSYVYSVNNDKFSPVVRPIKERELNLAHVGSSLNISVDTQEKSSDIAHMRGVSLKSAEGKGKDKMREKHRKDKSLLKDDVDKKSAKGKEKYSNQDSTYATEVPSSRLTTDHLVSETCKQNEYFENFERLGLESLDSADQHSSCKQENIVLILPKDFSRPSSSELRQKASPHRKSDQHNWGSFSDIFSIGEINPDESFSHIPKSHPLNHSEGTETELDVKLNDIIEVQGAELPTDSPSVPSEPSWRTVKAGDNASVVPKASSCSFGKSPRLSVELTGDSLRHQRFGFGIGKMTRSLSFRESSTHPPRRSTHVTTWSGPVESEGSAMSETLNSNQASVNGRARSIPFRRLLDPLLKSKVTNQMKENPDELVVRPSVSVEVPASDDYQASTMKALLHLTVKSGLPLFKFVVETNDEILASTVKSLSTLGKDDISWLYTFYSVHKVRKKKGRWKNQKDKPCEFVYNVVGQMRVSKPYIPSSYIPESLEKYKLKESVLCSVDSSKKDDATSEFISGRELAALIVKLPNETVKNWVTDSDVYDSEDKKSAQTVVILPGGDHSLPNEGVPSSLINRWRTGGLCDCGGWDEGCKLRILNDRMQNLKVLLNSRSMLMDVGCDLYDQGEVKPKRPFLRLVPFRDGLFSVEFDTKMSSLQAFSICVAIINSKQPTLTSDPSQAAYQVGSKPKFNRTRPPLIPGEGPEILTTPHPPLSPAGRV